MKHLLVLPEHTYAGYCSTGANKDWVACLAIEREAQESNPSTISETTEVVYVSLHGPHGGNLLVDTPKKLTMKQARVHFSKKCREKDGKAYTHVPFAPYLPTFGRPFGLPLMMPPKEEQLYDGEITSSESTTTETVPTLRYQVSIVKAAPLEKLQQLFNGLSYGVTEKVNGERCLLVFDGQYLRAYNRRGKPMSAPPTGAAHLCKLDCPFVIDGERLTGDLGGYFVAFDLLEWAQKPFTAFSYNMRITTLEEAMYQAGLLSAKRSTPTLAQSRSNSTANGLCLLVAAAGADNAFQVVEEVQAASGEGIIVRRLESPYEESPLKFKFLADIDAFVIAINDGVAQGSLKFGVLRSSDRAIIEVANVRSGLTDTDIRAVRTLLERGEHPVFTITFLPIRTIGLQLVEPRTTIARLRTDKNAGECTTDQFGPEKASLIAHAKPVHGMMFL